MADLATPSAAAMSTSDAAADATPKPFAGKPEKPDEVAFKTALEKARKALTDAQEHTKAAQGRVSSARPGNKDSPIAKRQQELRAQLSEIRTKQQGFKTSRAGTQDRMKALDTQLKAKIQDQKTAKARIPFKSADEVDREIARLEQQVDSGKMKLVDEKKTLADITALRKQRKAFVGFDESQKLIDTIKENLSETRKELDNPEFKSLSDEYTKIAAELDSIKAEQDVAFKDLNASRDALTKSRASQDEKYAAVKKLQDEYYQSKRAYMDYEREAIRQRDAKRKTEREAYILEKKRRDFDRDLEEASWPAYGDEIRACDNLIRLLDPSYVKSAATSGPGEFAAVAQRKVDESGLKGTKLSKKDEEEENYFVGSGGKKGKKGKKGRVMGLPASPAIPSEARDLGRFFDPGVVQQFETIGLTPPSSQEEITSVLERVKDKKQFWSNDQDRKTKENIATAQRKLDQLLSGANGEEPAATPTAPTSAPAAAGASNESTIEELRQLADEDGSAHGPNSTPQVEGVGASTDATAEVTKSFGLTSVADETAEAPALNGDAHAAE